MEGVDISDSAQILTCLIKNSFQCQTENHSTSGQQCNHSCPFSTVPQHRWELDLHKSPLTLPLSFALSERSTSTASYSRMASRMMFPSLLKRKSMGMVMSSVFLPSPAIWKRGAVSLLLPSLSSGQSTPDKEQTSCQAS